jgi:hypothetical protein
MTTRHSRQARHVWCVRQDNNYFFCCDICMLVAVLTTHCICITYETNRSKIIFLGAKMEPETVCWLRYLGRGRYIATNRKIPMYNYSHSYDAKFELKYNHLLTTLAITGEVLEDYPDSPGLSTDLTAEAASNILDSEDVMDTSGTKQTS